MGNDLRGSEGTRGQQLNGDRDGRHLHAHERGPDVLAPLGAVPVRRVASGVPFRPFHPRLDVADAEDPRRERVPDAADEGAREDGVCS